MDDAESAASEAARRDVKRAIGLLRQATERLAGASDRDSVGALVVHDDGTRSKAIDLIDFGLARYDRVTVVVLTPTTAQPRAKEKHHVNGAGDSQEGAAVTRR